MTLRTLRDFLSSEVTIHGGKRPVKILLSPEAGRGVLERSKPYGVYCHDPNLQPWPMLFCGITIDIDTDAKEPVRAIYEE